MPDITEKLERLAGLLEKGLLTREEFDEQKAALLAELGRGGMGRVIEARDPELRRSVAVKVVVDPAEVTEAQLARFVAEAQITGQLQHPNIVPVHEMGVSEDGLLYFVMK